MGVLLDTPEFVHGVRHCIGDDTETHEIWEADADNTTEMLVKAGVFAKFLEDRSYSIEHHRSNGDDGTDAYEVIVFTVDK